MLADDYVSERLSDYDSKIYQLYRRKNGQKASDLVEKVKNAFPGLETEEALKEHRNTVLDFISKDSAICAKEQEEIVGVLLFSKEKGIMAFPINSSSGLKTNSRAVIYKIDLENGFSLQGEIGTISNNYEEEVRRIVFVNGNYYTLSYSQVRVADMDSLNVFKIIDKKTD